MHVCLVCARVCIHMRARVSDNVCRSQRTTGIACFLPLTTYSWGLTSGHESPWPLLGPLPWPSVLSPRFPGSLWGARTFGWDSLCLFHVKRRRLAIQSHLVLGCSCPPEFCLLSRVQGWSAAKAPLKPPPPHRMSLQDTSHLPYRRDQCLCEKHRECFWQGGSRSFCRLGKCSITEAHPSLANSPFLQEYNISTQLCCSYNKIGLPLSVLAPSPPLILQFQTHESR